ncbi:MAG TPA: DNA polymerase Y family protein [Gemmataceae bacterium]|jgi:protein ImuB
MRRLLCLRLPNWPVQRVRAERPELRLGPLLLLRRDNRHGAVVAACCGQAREAGARAGMTAADAVALLDHTPLARPLDPTADTAALGRLAEQCEQFSPRVGWETVAGRAADDRSRRGPAMPWYGGAPEHLFLDVTGVSQLFGGEHELVKRVTAACRELGYAGRAALADTLGAAWAVAGGGEPVAVVPPGQLLAAIRPLPVGCLRLPDEMVATLARLGVGTVADLMRLPRAGLAARFGTPVLRRLDQALGTAPEILVPHRPPPMFEAAQALDYPSDRRDALDGILDGLIDHVTAALQAEGRGAVRVRVEFRCGPDHTARIDVCLYRPTDLAKPVRELVRLHCDRLALPGPVDRIRLWADQTIPLRPRQDPLFPDPAASADRPLADLLERLSSRLGPAAVVRPILRADPLPERAMCYVPLVGRQPRSGRDATRGVTPSAVSHRPLRLIIRPVPVAVEADTSDDPPAVFRWRHRWHVVDRLWGPERIETGWWRGGLVRRDYYRVETADGRRLWLFRDLVSGEWFLHGRFE